MDWYSVLRERDERGGSELGSEGVSIWCMLIGAYW